MKWQGGKNIEVKEAKRVAKRRMDDGEGLRGEEKGQKRREW